MKNNVAFFLPTRSGSLRVINKNTRPFAGIPGGLLENKLRQLNKSTLLSEIILSTNDEACIEIGEKYAAKDNRVRIDTRPIQLCLDTTNLQDLITYVPSITEADHILWGHVTTPMIEASDYDQAISVYLEKIAAGFDSLIGVNVFKNFLLDKTGTIINNNSNIPWPRTQDLETLYEVNHSIFITSRNIYLNTKNRVGGKPFLYEMDKLKSFDVDWEEDFKMAELIYEKHN